MMPEIARASTIPSSWYTRPEVLAIENEPIFLHTWQAVGQAVKVANPGDYFACEVAAEAVDFSDEIQQEDITICKDVQTGLQSGTYDRGRSVKRENGVYDFHALLEEFLGGALD